ncbi:hypothetical protein FYK55_15820 [Roseiconus nitratireducens]|uniref:Heme peroxidase n=1 Tax=Roseiconus nitratireducens TaxID=2605748 RepID=A0A5M6D693_9BACT|nr:peroxidase family protein [Roseiconus nitratireducens]KAA5542266.1 hypothetical protein FYK55_15820 [Roseiconus nitratireducens]
MKRIILPFVVLSAASLAMAADFPLTSTRSFDGSGNTIGGAAGTPLLRIAPANYPGNGSGDAINRPPRVSNARTISNVVVNQLNSLQNDRSLSDMVWAWGQFIDHDIDLTLVSSANGTADIRIEDQGNDPLAPGPILFDRSDFAAGTGTPGNPRQQINEITAFIDASNVHGSDAELASFLRTFEGGRLKSSVGDLLPLESGFFFAGDVRANENVVLTSLHTLFMREHNRLAERIANQFPHADDEEIYQLARKIVGAELQIITYNEFLPALLGPMAPSLADYMGFDDSVDPGIANEFSTAAYRFGHSMLSPNLVLANKDGPFGQLPLRDAFFNPDFLKNDPASVDFLINGLTYQRAQEVDSMLVDDVRNFLFGAPGNGGLDLASLNIQRGRDHGLPSYNAVRMAYGLAPAEDFDDISSDPVVQLSLAMVYESPDEIDAWVGGLAEDHVQGASVGELVGVALADQFARLRDGDFFFFLNDPDLDPQSIKSIIKLDNFRLSSVIHDNTSIKNVPRDVFILPD